MTSDSLGGQSVTIAIRGADIAVLGKVLQQQKRDGRAAVDLIESSQIAPQKGAPEPGKGRLVDVVG